MGSGKTRLGKKLAKDGSLGYVDLDQYIESKESITIQQLFETKGEAYFRELEQKCIKELLTAAEGPLVISLGGGAMQNTSSAQILLENCLVVYLKFSPKVLRNRLENSKTKRPLIAGLQGEELEKFIAKHLETREKQYSLAHLTLDNVMDITARSYSILEAYAQIK